MPIPGGRGSGQDDGRKKVSTGESEQGLAESGDEASDHRTSEQFMAGCARTVVVEDGQARETYPRELHGKRHRAGVAGVLLRRTPHSSQRLEDVQGKRRPGGKKTASIFCDGCQWTRLDAPLSGKIQVFSNIRRRNGLQSAHRPPPQKPLTPKAEKKMPALCQGIGPHSLADQIFSLLRLPVRGHKLLGGRCSDLLERVRA